MSSDFNRDDNSDSLNSKDKWWLLGIWIFITCICLFLVDKVLPQPAPRLLTVIDALGTIAGTATSTFVIVSAVYMYIRKDAILDAFRNLRARPEFYNTGHPFAKKNVHAVIIPVSSRGTEQPEWIINHLKPKYVAFLCSRESCGNALKLIDEIKECTFINQRKDLSEKIGEILNDPRDPQDAKYLTKCFIAEFLRRGITRDKIFVDTTGGMVPMSIGSFQGAEEDGVSTIYINGTVAPKMIIEDPRNSTHGDPIFMSDRTADAHVS